jgi:carboxyl-terminal processing protease
MDKQASLGTMRSRVSSMNFTVYPQPEPFLGKVVILTDYGTGSTSEVFAAGLQELGRAVVIGRTSAGAVLPSVFEKLPTGAVFQYAVSDYRSPKNVLIEGRGVEPDKEVSITAADLLAGRDPQLEAAIKYIKKQ